LTAHERWDGDTEDFLPVAFHQTQDPISAEDMTPALGATSIGMGVAYPIQDGRNRDKAQNGVGVGSADDPAYTVDTTGATAVAYNPYRTLNPDGSITSGFGKRPVVDALHGPTGNKEPLIVQTMAVRRLTPVEAERLMAFPDGHTATGADGKAIPDSTRYRMLGNAVVSNVVEWIGRRIVSVDAAKAVSEEG